MRTATSLKHALAAGAIAAAFCAAAPAHAVVMDYVFEGVITDGGDLPGLFGEPFASLTGHAITVRTSFDTEVNRLTIPFYADGVGSDGGITPLVAASIAIDGTSFTLPSPAPPVEAGLTLYPFFDAGDYVTLLSTVFLSSGNVADALSVRLSLRLDSLLLPTSLDAPFDLTSADAAGRFGGFFFVGRYDDTFYASDVGAGGDFTVTRAYAQIRPDPVAAPEPAAWSLMLLGFGVAGAALRRRTRQIGRQAAASSPSRSGLASTAFSVR